MSDWHGWSKQSYGKPTNPQSLHVGLLPNRKSVCLYEIDGSILTVLAYSRDKSLARQAMKLIDELVLIDPPEEP